MGLDPCAILVNINGLRISVAVMKSRCEPCGLCHNGINAITKKKARPLWGRDRANDKYGAVVMVFDNNCGFTDCYLLKSPWRMSRIKWVVTALPNAYFKSLGLYLLS